MKLFVGKLLLLGVILATFQLTVVVETQSKKQVARFEQIVSERPDILFFCDSCNAWVDRDDLDRRTISGILQSMLQPVHVDSLDGGAYHLGLYEAFIEKILRGEYRPRAVVIPINLRSFSSEWDSRPSYQFGSFKRQVLNSGNRFAQALTPLLTSLHVIKDDACSISEHQCTPVFDGPNQVGIVADFENSSYDLPDEEKLSKKFVYHYMYSLSPEHRKLKSLRKIVASLKAENVSVVCYVPPVDHKTGIASLGERFADRIGGNIMLVQQELAAFDVELLDLSCDLESPAFSWDRYPNEHLMSIGRNYVAARIAQHLSLQLNIPADDNAIELALSNSVYTGRIAATFDYEAQ